jgi:hypothetical protein
MKIATFIVHVTTLIFMITGIILFSIFFLGDIFFPVQGRNPLDLNREILVAGMLVVSAALLSFVSRFSRNELITTAVVAQLLMIAIAVWMDGGSWLVWELTKCTTLPFALSIALSLGIQYAVKHGQPKPDGDGLKPAP